MENNTLCNRHSLGVNNHTKMYVTYTRIYGWSDYGGESSYQPGYRLENMMWMTLLVYDYIIPGDYNSGKITLFRYLPDKIPELIIQFNIADVDLYNLRIIGEDIYITSEDDEFVSYYPESFRFPTTLNESVRMIVDGKVYLSAWVEEGWDDDNNCATEEYKYYEKMIVRDFKGNVLSETIGSLQQHPDGTWWIS